MRTVKQVSKLTGISIRTLHYYDEIGLLKPSSVNEAGYRLYDGEALEALRQILFFRELDFSLSGIKAIMLKPGFDRAEAYLQQRRLLAAKRDRLDGLIRLLDRMVKGEETMSFAEFDLKEYADTLEEFVNGNPDVIVEQGGDLEEFRRVISVIREDEGELAQIAARQYGSVENYTAAMKQNLEQFPEAMVRMRALEKDAMASAEKTEGLMRRLTADIAMDAASEEIRAIIGEIVAENETFSKELDLGEGYWSMLADGYASSPMVIEATDEKYGAGASAFIGEAIKAYWGL